MTRNVSIGLLTAVLFPLGVAASAAFLAVLLPIYVLVFPILALGGALYLGGYLANLVFQSIIGERISPPDEGIFNRFTASHLLLQGLFITLAYAPVAIAFATITAFVLPLFFLALSGYTAYLMSDYVIAKRDSFVEDEYVPSEDSEVLLERHVPSNDYFEQYKTQYKIFSDPRYQPQSFKFFQSFDRRFNIAESDDSQDLIVSSSSSSLGFNSSEENSF